MTDKEKLIEAIKIIVATCKQHSGLRGCSNECPLYDAKTHYCDDVISAWSEYL